MNFKIVLIIFIFLGNALLIFDVFADDDKEIQQNAIELSMAKIASKALQYNIRINSWREIPEDLTFRVNLKKLNSQEKWVEFIKKNFTDWSMLFETETGNVEVYLLPKGIDAKRFKDLKAFAQTFDAKFFLAGKDSAKQIPDREMETLPVLQRLKTLAQLEKESELYFERMVNPENVTDVYNFKVKYNDNVGMFLPFEKNGEPVKGKMEGFSSFYTFYHFVNSHLDELSAYQQKNKTFLKLKNSGQSIMMLAEENNRLQIVQQVFIEDKHYLDNWLIGNEKEFQSIAKIYQPKITTTFVDYAEIR